jgi:23S rRNA pseudouridine1911/1915/1917 synthase
VNMLRREDPVLLKLASRQMLHAWKLSFTHPVSGERLDFTCKPPRDFWRIPLHLCRRLQRVGVLGLPGSGKSTVLEALARRKWPTWSADRCVAELYQPGADCWHMLRSRYGERFVPDAESPVNKAALLEAMRTSESFRRELMDVLYPMVLHKLKAFWDAQADARAAFAEIPMLLEAGWLGAGVVDLAVGVSCPQAVRHERLAAKRGWDEATIALFDSWQWPEDKKLGACRHLVDNSGPAEEVQRRADALLDTLRRERAGVAGELLAWMRSKDYA